MRVLLHRELDPSTLEAAGLALSHAIETSFPEPCKSGTYLDSVLHSIRRGNCQGPFHLYNHVGPLPHALVHVLLCSPLGLSRPRLISSSGKCNMLSRTNFICDPHRFKCTDY